MKLLANDAVKCTLYHYPLRLPRYKVAFANSFAPYVEPGTNTIASSLTITRGAAGSTPSEHAAALMAVSGSSSLAGVSAFVRAPFRRLLVAESTCVVYGAGGARLADCSHLLIVGRWATQLLMLPDPRYVSSDPGPALRARIHHGFPHTNYTRWADLGLFIHIATCC